MRMQQNLNNYGLFTSQIFLGSTVRLVRFC